MYHIYPFSQSHRGFASKNEEEHYINYSLAVSPTSPVIGEVLTGCEYLTDPDVHRQYSDINNGAIGKRNDATKYGLAQLAKVA